MLNAQVIQQEVAEMGPQQDQPTTSTKHVYLSPDQVASMIPGVSKSTLAMWRYEGRGPRYRKAGRIIFYALDEVEAWIDEAACEGRAS
jgi:hypothetical protein